jgi:hypothetical protein
MSRSRGVAIDPLGEGLVARCLRIAEDDVVWLGTLLAGYDGLVMLYGVARDVILLVTTESRASELDAVLSGMRSEVSFEVIETPKQVRVTP